MKVWHLLDIITLYTGACIEIWQYYWQTEEQIRIFIESFAITTKSLGFLNFYSNENRIKLNAQPEYKRKYSTYRESLPNKPDTNTHTRAHKNIQQAYRLTMTDYCCHLVTFHHTFVCICSYKIICIP